MALLAYMFTFASLEASEDPREAILNALNDELNRSMQGLYIEGYEKPYYISYQLKLTRSNSIEARYGSIFNKGEKTHAEIYVEVRVGSYELDNSGKETFDFFFNESMPLDPSAPLDNELTALKNALWISTDSCYKKAVSDYLQRKGKKIYEAEDKKIDSFSREDKSIYSAASGKFDFDANEWESRTKEISLLFKDHPHILQSKVFIKAETVTRYQVSSEGTRIADDDAIFNLMIEGVCKAEDGMLLDNHRTYYAADSAHLPSMQTVSKETLDMIAELEALRSAPALDPYTGPAILDAQAAGVLFHEAVGHRLEGERQDDEEEGRTFKGQIGQPILPEFLDLIDDPTMADFGEIGLNGHYSYDDEGVKAQKVVLVEKGILKNFLMSRSPIEGFNKSNGHGRAASTRKPTARMGNTLLISHNAVSYAELKKRLLQLIKKQNKPYGLVVRDMDGGSTNTSTYGYQAYKGIPRIVFRVFPDGREELVRGVELVGTPIASINKILATSDTSDVFNGYCGAESGYVPVSAIAPALLLQELELQRKKEEKERLPILPSPFNGTAK